MPSCWAGGGEAAPAGDGEEGAEERAGRTCSIHSIIQWRISNHITEQQCHRGRSVERACPHALSLPARIRPAFSGFAPLAVPNYRRFAGSNVLAMSATWMQRIAQDWLVLQLTHSVAAVGVTTADAVRADAPLRAARRRHRRPVPATDGPADDHADARSACSACCSPSLALTGTATVWLVWATAFAIGCIDRRRQPRPAGVRQRARRTRAPEERDHPERGDLPARRASSARRSRAA